ncbi:DNA alkylation repair protein [soil metagenome]
MPSPRKPFKDWFDRELVGATRIRIAAVEPRFDAARFESLALENLETREMMARVGQIADALHSTLPTPVSEALVALVKALPKPGLEGGRENGPGQGYLLWPWGEFIARYGLDDVDASFAAMLELTRRFTSEFAVRPFLARDPEGILHRLAPLVRHPEPSVRRWVSEGTRTRLPWRRRIPPLEAPEHVSLRLELLAALRRDPSRYVQRSVANHLQDLLRDDRDVAFGVLVRWAREGAEPTDWIVKHAARGLLRAGDAEALALFGFRTEGLEVEVVEFSASAERACVGDVISLALHLRNTGAEEARLRLDYLMEHPGAAERPRRKVFRISDLPLGPGEEIRRRVTHAFVHRSIRVVRPGLHRFTLQVNGSGMAAVDVTVGEAPPTDLPA